MFGCHPSLARLFADGFHKSALRVGRFFEKTFKITRGLDTESLDKDLRVWKSDLRILLGEYFTRELAISAPFQPDPSEAHRGVAAPRRWCW